MTNSFFSDSFTYVNVENSPFSLKAEDRNMILGSCFAENLNRYFEDNYLDCFFSPFGNIYNPLSLSSALNLLCSSRLIS
ncbi:MAG: GSCFA domain-containing protein, partial [Proteobacteria bacterium]|nr:GSCFA domain-containing protein [Pseudomonadota bacterium]